jgi:DNA-binding NarL/FixJ family response regulator
MIRVLICDDQDVVLEGLQTILRSAPEIQVVGVAHDGAEALEKITQVQPEVVLMDLKMPGMNGIQATRQIRDQFPAVHVLVLTTYDADEWVFDAIRSGASGYLLKDTPRQELIAAVKGTASGKSHIDPNVAGKLLNRISHTAPAPESTIMDKLNERELAILKLLARGFSNGDIAQRLYLSEGTIKNYVSSILDKLGVSDRTQAAVIALRYGLADLSES